MNEEIKKKTIGEYVAFHRFEKHLNKSELARRIGVSSQYVRDIEDNRAVPSEEVLEILVSVLDMDERETYELANKLPPRIIEQTKKRFYGGELK